MRGNRSENGEAVQRNRAAWLALRSLMYVWRLGRTSALSQCTCFTFFFSVEAHRDVLQAFNPCTARPRTARSTPRPRARRNRALVKAALCSLECIVLMHLQRGDLRAKSESWVPRLTLPRRGRQHTRAALPCNRGRPVQLV